MDSKMSDNLEERLSKIGLQKDVIKNTLANTKLATRLSKVLDIAKIDSCSKQKGALLYKVATKLPASFENRLEFITKYVAEDKITTDVQLEAALSYIKTIGDTDLNIKEFEESSGVGITITDKDIENTIKKMFEENKEAILKERYMFNFVSFLHKAKKALKWGDGKKIFAAVEKLKTEYLGPKTKEDEEKINVAKTKGKSAKEGKEGTTEEFKKERLSKIIARDLSSSLNSKRLLEEHKKIGYSVVTRFPPEPNGILHIGHAKAMRHNFTLAEDYGGVCYLRFDDTNPEKENKKFMTDIEECVHWLGYKPWKVTFASDYFPKLYEYAIQLIKDGKAYVCHQTKKEMTETRTKGIESPWRNRSVEDNLKYFEWMRQGRYKEKEAMLRLKIDMKHPNTTMRDPVAYRVKYVPHPHAGDKWCIYPMYDFTHGISDSIENITHSCCSLEFEIRRDLYYWILEALDIYRAFVWEFSRLNVTHSVMSKRLLQSLLDDHLINDWDDPRLLTLLGLKRRGVRPEAINEFCDLVGVTRRGNEMMISDKLLEHCIRKDLDVIAPRTMGVLDPLLVVIDGKSEDFEEKYEINIFPKDPSKGKQSYTLTKNLFIERSDYLSEAPNSFRGLTKSQAVLLKYTKWIKVKEEVRDSSGEVVKLVVMLCDEKPPNAPGVIHWVSEKYSLKTEVRLYGKLFLEEDPKTLGDKWKDCINKESLKVMDKALIWDHLAKVNHLDRFQFERIGYFAVDYDTDASKGRYVFNLIVNLSESKEKFKPPSKK
jgi:glutaminyl-tRNA synthetase